MILISWGIHEIRYTCLVLRWCLTTGCFVLSRKHIMMTFCKYDNILVNNKVSWCDFAIESFILHSQCRLTLVHNDDAPSIELSKSESLSSNFWYEQQKFTLRPFLKNKSPNKHLRIWKSCIPFGDSLKHIAAYKCSLGFTQHCIIVIVLVYYCYMILESSNGPLSVTRKVLGLTMWVYLVVFREFLKNNFPAGFAHCVAFVGIHASWDYQTMQLAT